MDNAKSEEGQSRFALIIIRPAKRYMDLESGKKNGFYQFGNGVEAINLETYNLCSQRNQPYQMLGKEE